MLFKKVCWEERMDKCTKQFYNKRMKFQQDILLYFLSDYVEIVNY